MKKSILLTLTLIISYASIGQKITILKSDTAIMECYYINPTELQYYKNLLHKSRIDDGRSQFQFYGENNRPKELLRLNSKGDTLEISIPSVKFIKIDGFIYEIKRYSNISIEKVKPNWTTVLTDLAKKVDTINAKKQN